MTPLTMAFLKILMKNLILLTFKDFDEKIDFIDPSKFDQNNLFDPIFGEIKSIPLCIPTQNMTEYNQCYFLFGLQ
jgi:hypothetical protein